MKLGLIAESQVGICVSPQDRAGNSHLLRYWSKYYKILEDKTVEKRWQDLRYFEVPVAMHPTVSGDCLFYSHAAALAQVEWEKKGLSPLLALHSEDHAFGLDVLAKNNISPSDWFVALHVREPGYHNQWEDPLRKGRDVDIYTYLDAIQEITRAGGWVIRMGDPTMKPLPPMERVWDYAHSPDRSERMDVFLMANCRFFVGTNSGVSYVPPVFGRPCLYTNWCALDHRPWWSQNLLIHKNIRGRKSGDLLPYSRMIPPPFGHIESIEYLNSHGLDLVDNTSEEIVAAVIEMMQYVEKTPNQEKVLSMANKTYQQIAVEAGGYAGPRICETFLDKYPQLLK
jgi:putative glycosyltransferase (TIGR04372 family)